VADRRTTSAASRPPFDRDCACQCVYVCGHTQAKVADNDFCGVASAFLSYDLSEHARLESYGNNVSFDPRSVEATGTCICIQSNITCICMYTLT